jgi:hypothetical protein
MNQFFHIILSLIFISGCSPSQRALNALNKGDQCEFCKISLDNKDTDPYSYNNLGICHENGWCNFIKDRAIAINSYTMAARWGIQQAGNNLTRLGVTVPVADLKIAKDRQNNAVLGGIIAAALVGGLLAVAGHNSRSGGTGNNYQVPSVFPDDDLQGCCAWHNGISRGMLNQPNCHFTGMVLCKDFQPSPTCKCN